MYVVYTHKKQTCPVCVVFIVINVHLYCVRNQLKEVSIATLIENMFGIVKVKRNRLLCNY